MIESIELTNFKALRETTLPLAPFTLLLGPNGSGKSSVLQALRGAAVRAAELVGVVRQDKSLNDLAWQSLVSAKAKSSKADVDVKLHLRLASQVVMASFRWRAKGGQVVSDLSYDDGAGLNPEQTQLQREWLAEMQFYALNAERIADPSAVTSEPLQYNGAGLAAVLDDLKDNYPERWNSLLTEMCEWLPEFDHIQFDKPSQGAKAIALRTKKGGHRIPARELSQGTLIALALLTLAYSPEPPTLIGLEEIDRGLHPRLLRHLQDALYRLSYPESCGEARPPVQVIATTHSPYLLDLYRDHPEEIVLAEKQGLDVTMKRLSDIDHFEEILGDSPLSDVWYSGVLGGVSVKP